MALQSAGCIRNLGLLAIGTTLLTLLFLILSNGNTRGGASYQPVGVNIPSHQQQQAQTNVPIHIATAPPRPPPQQSQPPHHPHGDLGFGEPKKEEPKKEEPKEEPKKEHKNKGKVVVILPKDERTGGDFGFKQGGWLERAIANRKDYADLHGEFFLIPLLLFIWASKGWCAVDG